jgi:iron complex outermembrane recepter protein
MFNRQGAAALSLLPLVLGLTGWPVVATGQPALERVEITGTGLRRIAVETSVPVTIVRMDELLRQGITQIEQAIAWVASNQGSIGMGAAVGSVTGGKAEADLRGLSSPFATSANKTLVLLNGRRLVNHPFDGAAVDLYSLPMAAIDRIEILRDGASAIYGSDAIGGVINVILKREQNFSQASVDAQGAQHGGGATRRFSLVTGAGNLEQQGFHAQAALDVRKQNRLAAIDRPFSSTGVLRGNVVDWTSGTSFPGDFDGFEPSLPGCARPGSIPSSDGISCRYDVVRELDAIPANEQRTAIFRGELNLSRDLSAAAEFLWSRNHEASTIAAAPGFHCMRADSAFFPVGATTSLVSELCRVGDGVPTFAGGLVDWREIPAGNRKRDNTTIANRALLELKGAIDSNWDFRSAIGRSQSRSTEKVLAGYVNDETMQLGVWNGIINPFGPQTAAGQAAIDSAQIVAPVQTGLSRSDFADLRLRGELFNLDAGPLALAIGLEHRQDRSSFDTLAITSVLPSLGLDANGDTTGSRRVSAVYGEIGWPVTRFLDITAAARLDRYSDFGRTFNPKLGMRLQAAPGLLLRGSMGSGFRAPSLYEVYRPQAFGFTAGIYHDPLYCPGGVPVSGVNSASVCSQQFNVRTGGPVASGNSIDALRPEQSKNLSMGLVLATDKAFSIGFDFWLISVKNLIGGLPEQAVFDDQSKYSARYVRCSQLSSGSGSTVSRDQLDACLNTSIDPIAYIDLPTENLGTLKTSGLDISTAWRGIEHSWGRLSVGLDGTYVYSYRYQRERNGSYIDAAGRYADNAPIFRWQHSLAVNWALDAWSLTLAQRFKSGYVDQSPDNHVPAYVLHDLVAQWRGIRNLTLSVGIRNLFDQDPPQTLQLSTFQAGYDPRFTDPLGRVLALHADYRF